MSTEKTREVIEAWYKGDIKQLADDVVFLDMGNAMGSGKEKITRGRVYVLVDLFRRQVGVA